MDTPKLVGTQDELDLGSTSDKTDKVEMKLESVQEKPFQSFEKAPCNWEIEMCGNGILARNGVSGRVYEGSMKVFNELLRG